MTRDYTNAKVKIDRSALRHAIERCLYLREYDQALNILHQGYQNVSNDRERDELESLHKTVAQLKYNCKQSEINKI